MTSNATPIDPLEGPRLALSGRIACMDNQLTIISDGVIYIEKGLIVEVQRKDQQPPIGFESIPIVETGGTLFPGLIELHNHLSYNALPLWKVPRKFTNRDQWGRLPEYRELVSGPMRVVGRTPGLLAPLVRYVECKALVAGVTTTQGIQLASNSAVRSYYKGIVRNVEATDDQDLPEANTRIDDVDARDVEKFFARLTRSSCLLLHLSEGVDDRARKHFLALKMGRDRWAISRQLASIHCAGLKDSDFAILQDHNGSMVWSPMSNLLLYGQTALAASAKQEGVRMGIGSDWSPTGSRNLLCELKVAQIYSQHNGGFLSDVDIVRAVTCDAAAVVGWQNAVGVLEKGKRADILVIEGKDGDPYASLITTNEKGVLLVMINGIARFGTASVMEQLHARGEKIKIGGEVRRVYLRQKSQDPRVASTTLKKAATSLRKAFRRLPTLAKELEQREVRRFRTRALGGPEPVEWTLALDELEETGLNVRPRLPLEGMRGFTGPALTAARAAKPLSKIVKPMQIDALTVVDDSDYLDLMVQQRNLPAYVKTGLAAFY
jgi:cytosine/adenosine deaminase-related metal-dependent hydrolase